MKERREGRVGTVSGLALLAGGTALAAAVGGDHQSVSATLLLGTLTLGLGHSLLEEMRRQARRASARWSREDTTNAALLGVWAEAALLISILAFNTAPTRGLGLALAVAYAACCGYFVTERRRAVAAQTETTAITVSGNAAPAPDQAPGDTVDDEVSRHLPTTAEVGVFWPPSSAALADLDEPGRPDPDRHPPATIHTTEGIVLPRRRPGGTGHAPTNGHGPMTRPHPAVPTSTMAAQSHQAKLHGPTGSTSGLPDHSRPAKLHGPTGSTSGLPDHSRPAKLHGPTGVRLEARR